jgi:hypothetical protein
MNTIKDSYTRLINESEVLLIPSYILSESQSDSIENRLNSLRLHKYKELFSERLLQLLYETDFEYGYKSEVDTFIQDKLRENASVTKDWLNSIYNKYYNDVKVVTGILRTIAHFEYNEISPQGPTMALAALAHKNAEIRECGIRSFENWSTFESLVILKNIHCSEKWLQSYLSSVINDLEETYNK